jgi:hypothetical protein
VQDQLLEGVPSLRHDEQPMGGPAGREDLLDRAPARDQLLIGSEQVGWRQAGVRARPGRGFEGWARPRSGVGPGPGSCRGAWPTWSTRQTGWRVPFGWTWRRTSTMRHVPPERRTDPVRRAAPVGRRTAPIGRLAACLPSRPTFRTVLAASTGRAAIPVAERSVPRLAIHGTTARR